jgi:hypothetical protein
MIWSLRALALATALLVAAPALGGLPAQAETAVKANPSLAVHYRTAVIEGVSLFYREAGPVDGPVVLLLHGFPTSSHMFRNLIPTLADR